MSANDKTPVMRRYSSDDLYDPGPSRRSRSRSPRRYESRRDRDHVRGPKLGHRDEHTRTRTWSHTCSPRQLDRNYSETSSRDREAARRDCHSREARQGRDSRDRRERRDHTPERDRNRDGTRRRDRSRDGRSHRRDSDSRRARHHSRDRSRDRSKHHRRRRRRSHTTDGSSSSGSSPDSEDDRRRKRRKDRKKDKGHKMHTKTVASTGTWGKYGVINDANISSKQTEFRTWLIEEKRLNPETLSKDRLRKETLAFVEDFNTASLPHEKFYDIEAYKIKVEMIRTGQTLPLDLGSYDATADLKAHTSRVKAEKQKGKKLSREEVEELRQIEKERVEIGRMRLLGMDVSRTMGVRTDYVKREEMVFDDKPFP